MTQPFPTATDLQHLPKQEELRATWNSSWTLARPYRNARGITQ